MESLINNFDNKKNHLFYDLDLFDALQRDNVLKDIEKKYSNIDILLIRKFVTQFEPYIYILFKITSHTVKYWKKLSIQERKEIIEKALAVQWDTRLLRAYRHCAAPEGSSTLLAQIENGERWSRERPNDPELLLVLGALCLKQKLWGKAQRHLEQAMAGTPEQGVAQEAHLRLAQMHEALNQSEAAAIHYRQCALTTQQNNAKLPSR